MRALCSTQSIYQIHFATKILLAGVQVDRKSPHPAFGHPLPLLRDGRGETLGVKPIASIFPGQSCARGRENIWIEARIWSSEKQGADYCARCCARFADASFSP